MKKYSTASAWPERNPSSPLIEDARRVLSEMEQNGLKRGLNEPEVYVMRDHCQQVSRGYQR